MTDTSHRNASRTKRNYLLLLLVATACLLATLGVGLISGVLTARPGPTAGGITLHALQPLHTTLALAWLFAGSAALVGLYAADGGRLTLRISRAQLATSLLFLGGAIAALAQRRFSGREYLTWPVLVSLPLLGSFLLNLWTVLVAWKKLVAHFRERGNLLACLGFTLTYAVFLALIYVITAASFIEAMARAVLAGGIGG